MGCCFCRLLHCSGQNWGKWEILRRLGISVQIEGFLKSSLIVRFEKVDQTFGKDKLSIKVPSAVYFCWEAGATVIALGVVDNFSASFLTAGESGSRALGLFSPVSNIFYGKSAILSSVTQDWVLHFLKNWIHVNMTLKSLSIIHLLVPFKKRAWNKTEILTSPYHSLVVFINSLRNILLEFTWVIHVLSLFYPSQIISIFKYFQMHTILKEGKYKRQ